MNADYASFNDRQRERLLRLVKPAGPEDLLAPGENWPAYVELAHLAFWDRRAAGILRRWNAGKAPPEDPEWYGGADLLNESLEPTWRALSPEEAVRLAVEASAEIDSEVAGTEAALAAEIQASGRDWLLNRWRHRGMHLDQIEKALRR